VSKRLTNKKEAIIEIIAISNAPIISNFMNTGLKLGGYEIIPLKSTKSKINDKIVIIKILIIIDPLTFLNERIAISKNPNAANKVSEFEKSPRLKNVESLEIIIPPFLRPIKPIKKPTPDAIAILKFVGILSIIHFLNEVTLIIKNKTPEIKTAPKAVSQEYPISPTTEYVKNAFKPMPGAKPTGQFAVNPIIKQAIEAAKQVPTKTAPKSIPVEDIICGFTKMMYDIVIKVVKPAKISFLIFVL
tara:strand:- start:944 stop:1678 length:735 start_codon:yes stop_codon:yes gene_type:complete